MTTHPSRDRALRFQPWVGARARFGYVVCTVALVFPAMAVAQDPPDPVEVADSLPEPDSAQAEAALDSVPEGVFYNLPEFADAIPAGWHTGVWVWDVEDIMASAANTLAELVAEVPGVITLLAGDYGTPAAFSAFGTGGGGVRIIRDGFEVFPLEGGVADLQRVGLGGIWRVKLYRSGGESVVEMWSLQHEDGRPYTLVEAGTGDLDTNVFRGTFASPDALGGSIGVALERADTRGRRREEPGSRTGSWVRYQLHKGDGAGLALEFRRMSSRSQVPDYASDLTRTDVTIRGRLRPFPGGVLEAYTGRSSHTVADTRTPYLREGGRRSQHGLRVSATRSGVWGRGAYRLFGGDEALEHRLDGSVGFTRAGLGGVEAHYTRAGWSGTSTSSQGGRGWIEALPGVTLFGSVDSGTYGARTGPPLDVIPVRDSSYVFDPTVLPIAPGPVFGVTERTAFRGGGAISLFGATASGALLRADSDVHLPLGIEPDRGAPLVVGAARTGWEVWGSFPMPLTGLRLEGSFQQWASPGPYLPKHSYGGAFRFQRIFMESGNFELRFSLGVRAHDAMLVSVPVPEGEDPATALQTVPSFQSWYGRVLIRVVSARLFINWENMLVNDELQNFPDRLLFATRTSYGLRWTMWN